MKQVTVRELLQDHSDIEAGQASPYVTDMERFYFSKPQGFRAKIMLARWIPEETRKHMIVHVRAMLIAAANQRKRVRKVAFTAFLRDPVIKRAATKRFVYGKHKDGSVWKQDRRTGRFSRFSKREREAIKSGNRT